MKHIIFLCLFVFAFARENPFVPVTTQIKATNIKEYENFDEKSASMPSSARVLKSITFTYQNLDGSIKNLKVPIEKSINWHDPLVLTTKSKLINSVVPEQNEQIKKPNEQQNKQNLSKQDEQILQQLPFEIASKPKEPKVFTFSDDFSFSVQENLLTIMTKDKIIRHFKISNPDKIVIDFKSDVLFYTKTIDINLPPFLNVTFGSHDGYYRTSFVLDGIYAYEFSQQNNDTFIKLK